MYTRKLTKTTVDTIIADINTYFDFEKLWFDDLGYHNHVRPQVIVDKEKEKLVILSESSKVVIPYGAIIEARDCLKTLRKKIDSEYFDAFFYGDNYLADESIFTFSWAESNCTVTVIGDLWGMYVKVGEIVARVA